MAWATYEANLHEIRGRLLRESGTRLEELSLSDFLDVVWSMRLEGAGAFTDPSKYRTAMYYVFYKGEEPPKDDTDREPRRGRSTTTPRKKGPPSISAPLPAGALDRLRALNNRIAETKRSAE